MRISIALFFGMGMLNPAFAEGEVKLNYDYGCSTLTDKAVFGNITRVHCFDEKFKESAKLYLNEKEVAESADPIYGKEIFKEIIIEKPEILDEEYESNNVKLYYSTHKDAITKELKTTFYLLNYFEKQPFLYKINGEIKIYINEKEKKILGKRRGEEVFRIENGKIIFTYKLNKIDYFKSEEINRLKLNEKKISKIIKSKNKVKTYKEIFTGKILKREVLEEEYKSDKVKFYYSTHEDVLTKNILSRNYYLVSFLQQTPKFYKIHVGVKIYVNEKENEINGKRNGEIVFTIKDGKLSIPAEVIKKGDFSPSEIEEVEINENDPLIASKKAKEIYKKNANNDEVVKAVMTPLGKWELTDMIFGSLKFYSKDKPDRALELVHVDSINEKIPGVLAVNESKTLILTYFSYPSLLVDRCGKSLALFDMSHEEMTVTTFGVSLGCDLFKSVKFIGEDEAIITILPNLEFHYKNREMTLPAANKDYAALLKYRWLLTSKENYKEYKKIEKELKLEGIKEIDESEMSVEELYNKYRPYYRRESIPLFIGNREIQNTGTGILMIENYKDILNRIMTSKIYYDDRMLYSGVYTPLETSEMPQILGKYYAGTLYEYVNYDQVWNEHNEKCGSEGYLIDVTEEEPKMYTFGNRNACNKVADISEEKDRLEIKMDDGQKYYYSKGKFTLPKASKNYSLTFPEELSLEGKDKTGVELYKAFPPYAE